MSHTGILVYLSAAWRHRKCIQVVVISPHSAHVLRTLLSCRRLLPQTQQDLHHLLELVQSILKGEPGLLVQPLPQLQQVVRFNPRIASRLERNGSTSTEHVTCMRHTFKDWIARWYASSLSEGTLAFTAAVCHREDNTNSGSSCEIGSVTTGRPPLPLPSSPPSPSGR